MAKERLKIDKESYYSLQAMLRSQLDSDVNLAIDLICSRNYTGSPVYALMLLREFKEGMFDLLTPHVKAWLTKSGINHSTIPTYKDIQRKAVTASEEEKDFFQKCFSEHVKDTLVKSGYLFIKKINIEINDELPGIVS